LIYYGLMADKYLTNNYYIRLEVSTLFLLFKYVIQVKTMRALQYFPTIEDPSARRALFEVLFLLEINYRI
jgi:hypothetical protein